MVKARQWIDIIKETGYIYNMCLYQYQAEIRKDLPWLEATSKKIQICALNLVHRPITEQ